VPSVYKPQHYLREKAHTGSISRRLAARGNTSYEFSGTEPGYSVSEFSKSPVVAMVEVLGVDRLPQGRIKNGLIGRARMADRRAEMLRKLWSDAVADQYYVAWAWTSNGSIDTSRLLISGWPIEVQYSNTLAPEPISPLANAVASAELAEEVAGPDHGPLEDPWFAPPLFETRKEGLEALQEAVAGLTAGKDQEGPEESQEALQGPQEQEGGEDEDWSLMGDLFISPEEVAGAVAEIRNAHKQALDAAASAMERRLHAQVLHAIAAGSPYGTEMANQLMEIQHMYFHRA